VLQHYTIKDGEIYSMITKILKTLFLFGSVLLIFVCTTIVLDFKSKDWQGLFQEKADSHIKYMHTAVDDIDKDLHRAIDELAQQYGLIKEHSDHWAHGENPHHLHHPDGRIIWEDEWIVKDHEDLP
jgi:hypothetical protein